MGKSALSFLVMRILGIDPWGKFWRLQCPPGACCSGLPRISLKLTCVFLQVCDAVTDHHDASTPVGLYGEHMPQAQPGLGVVCAAIARSGHLFKLI